MNLCRDFLTDKGRREEREVSFDREIDSADPSESDSLWDKFQYSEAAAGGAEESPEAKLLERDIHDRLLEALSRLPQMQRETLLFHYLYDMKYREIAKLTGVSVSTVKSRVRQGTEKLRGIMEKKDFWE